MSDTIIVMRVTPVSGQGNLRAFADVRVGEITVCDCRVIQQAGQVAYVAGPQKQERGRWWPLVKMSPELRERVQSAVLGAWQKLQEAA